MKQHSHHNHPHESFDHEEHEFLDEEKRSPLNIILSLFLILIIILMVVPFYGVTLDPQPTNIPTLPDILPLIDKQATIAQTQLTDIRQTPRIINNPTPNIKLIADNIALTSCNQNHKTCHAKALFYFVRDELNYISDPAAFEFIKHPQASILSQGGDCDDASTLLATLLNAVGIPSRLVLVPGHVYVEAQIPSALKKYKNSQGFIPLDPTCPSCDFAELPISSKDKEKSYIYTS